MTMLLAIAGFEFRYLSRNPLLWVTAAVTFAIFFVGIGAGLELTSEGGLLANGAFPTLGAYLMTSLSFMFVTTAFVANAVIRDDETGYGPIVRSTSLTKSQYLVGRFLGAFAIAALCLLLLPVGIVLATLMPWTDPATIGPNRLADHLYGYLVIALPNLFVHSAIFFVLATVTRSMMATYLGVVGFMSGFFVLQGALVDRPQLHSLVALLDPFGARAMTDAVRYWTIGERNVGLPELAGTLLYNRLLWIGIAVLCLVLAHRVYRFADRGMSRREQKRQRLAGQGSAGAGVPSGMSMASAVAALPNPHHGPAALRALLWMRTRFELKQVVLHPAFAVLLAWASYITALVLLTQRDPDGRPTYPTTRSLIPEIDDPMSTLLPIIAIYYAGELVWRERDRRMDPIIDATPMPSWAYVIPKTLALAGVFVAILMMSVVASVAVQLSLDFTQLELGKYLAWFVVPKAWDLLLLAALAIFVQALSPHKAVGWGIMVLLMIAQQLNGALDHNLVLYGGTPGVPFSDMNGSGSFGHGAWTFRVYWGGFAVLLLVAAHLLWRRGTDVRLAQRVAHARRRLRGAPGRVAAGAALTFLVSGCYAYYNTNVLNTYRTGWAAQDRAAAYEMKYGRYADLPQPKVVELTIDVALHPDQQRAATRGRLVLRNVTPQPIPEIHVRTLGDDLKLVNATIGGAVLTSDDSTYAHRIYRLQQPMQPGEERVMEFETRIALRGFRNQPTFTRIVENGTFLGELHLLPLVGVSSIGMLQNPETRRRYGLPEAQGIARLEDSSAAANTTPGRGWAKTDITVSTSADQVPIAPGNRVSDEVRGGRRIARFISVAPVHPRFSIQSARYAEKHRAHRGIDLAVYHHPGHAWNVDRMLDALAASVDYYQEHFGPYPFDHARIAEFPGYLDFAQAMPGTIPYSEDVGFVSDYAEPETMDYVTYLTAHELAHQYWAHQVVGADMEGRELLSETLAQYSAQMVVKRLRGEDYMRRYLQYELDRYLEGRAAGWDEPPLVRVAGQDHVTYRKGALAMYLMQVRLGEDAVNRALRALLERYRFKGAPYPRSLDLVAALRAEATTAEDSTLITDLFERITLYDLRVEGPTAVRRADGRWDVTVPVRAKKLYADGKGGETDAPLAERIEIGLFTAEPGRDAFDARHVIAIERRPIRSGAQVVTFVTARKPTHAGVDPYNYYIDRNSRDNVVRIVDPG